MSPVDEYVRVIERDTKDISSLWRILQIFFYLLGAITGYLGTIFFYTLWQDIFDGQCPLWRSVSILTHGELNTTDDFVDDEDTYVTEVMNVTDWRLHVIVTHTYNSYCNTYFIIMICSTAFGIIWLTFFHLCGKGGYDGDILEASWRVVIAAFLFNFIFSLVALYTAHSISDGFAQFSVELENVYSRLTGTEMLRLYDEECNIIQTYVYAYKGNRFNVCKTFKYIKVLAWLMSASWIAGLILLLVRILTGADFRFVKVTVYNVPREDTATTSNGEEKQKNK